MTNEEKQKRFEEQLNFILEVDKLKNIGRQTYVSDGQRKENDAEHSWHLALMAFILKEHANEEVDILKVMLMVLIHDIVEIDAGDTYAYDEAANRTKAHREQVAAERIFGLLPQEQGEQLRALWEEFEARETVEAKYANSLDKLQPIMLNNATRGKAWQEHQVTREKVEKRFADVQEGSVKMWEHGMDIIEDNTQKGNLLI